MDGFKTYIGIIVAVAPSVANLFGFTLAPTFGEEFTHLAAELITLAGAVFAFYGRAKAVTPGWIARRNAE